MAVDKDELYGDFRNGQEKKSNLFMKAAHKALDIADDDMNISPVTNVKNGFGWKEMLAAAAIGAVGLWGYNLISSTPAVDDMEYEVRFYDADGNQIEVPRLPQ